jgi:hypothetical protein
MKFRGFVSARFAAWVVLSIALLLSGGCCNSSAVRRNASSPTSAIAASEQPLLNREGAILVARAVAQSRGINLRQFRTPIARSELDGDHRIWYIQFWGRDTRVQANYFYVRVNDQTAEAVFYGGR